MEDKDIDREIAELEKEAAELAMNDEDAAAPPGGVVMLHKPPIDKIMAMAVLESILGYEIPIAKFWDSNECTDEQMKAWDYAVPRLIPIDIGDEKYRQSGFASATERMSTYTVRRERLSPGEVRLISLANANNTDGRLKGAPTSIAWIIRELYEFAGWNHREIIRRAADVVHAFRRVEDGEGDPERTQEGLEDAFPNLCRAVRKSNSAPLTAGRYLSDLWTLGFSPEEIDGLVRWWLLAWWLASAACEEGKRVFEEKVKKDPSTLFFDAGEFRTVAFHTHGDKFTLRVRGVKEVIDGDRFIVKAAGRDKNEKGGQNFPLRVVKNPDGHALIVRGKDVDVSALYRELLRREPKKWFADKQGIQNGGQMYPGVPPTDLSLHEIIALVKRFPPVRMESKRGRQHDGRHGGRRR